MSIRENLELYGLEAPDTYFRVLTGEFGATAHPTQANAYLSEGLPFYAPRMGEDHVTVLGFNGLPLPYSLVNALIVHPELFSDEILVRWTQEQDLVLEATLGQLRAQGATR